MWREGPLPTGEGRCGDNKLYFDAAIQAERGCDFDFAMPDHEDGAVSGYSAK